MRFDGAKADAAKARDFDVGVTERDQPQHLLLARRESARRVPRQMQPRELDAQRGLQVGLSPGDRAYARDELSGRGRLEQVAPRASPQGLENVTFFVVHAEDDDADGVVRAQQLAEQEGVDIKLYRIIYEAVNDVRAALEGMLRPESRELIIGEAQVREIFKISKTSITNSI